MWLSILNKTSKRVRMNDLVQYRNIIKNLKNQPRCNGKHKFSYKPFPPTIPMLFGAH